MARAVWIGASSGPAVLAQRFGAAGWNSSNSAVMDSMDPFDGLDPERCDKEADLGRAQFGVTFFGTR